MSPLRILPDEKEYQKAKKKIQEVANIKKEDQLNLGDFKTMIKYIFLIIFAGWIACLGLVILTAPFWLLIKWLLS